MNLTPTLVEISRNDTPAFNKEEINIIHVVLNKFPANTQVSLAKIINGQPHFYGAIKRDGIINLVSNTDAIFDIGSVAKIFTSAILAQNVLSGKISLDDNIDQYLGLKLNNNSSVSFKQLATHTSGLPRLPPGLFWEALFKNSDNPYKDYSEARLLEFLQYKLKPKKIGTLKYSNLGVGLLGYILSQINECSYEDLIQDFLCKPLQLNCTTTKRKKVKGPLVMGQNKKGKEVPFWQLNALTGAGGIYSSVSDLVKLIVANFDESNPAFALQHQVNHQVNAKLSVALGWFSVGQQTAEHSPYLWHNGGTAGFSSQVLMDVKNKNGLVLLSNISAMHLIKGRLIGNLAKELFENIKVKG